jgi:hypothetical protein
MRDYPKDLFGTGAEWDVLDALGRGYTSHLHMVTSDNGGRRRQ